MNDPQLYELAERVGHALKARGLTMTVAESCTGGWIAQAVTAVPGSSAWFERGFVTYTSSAKQEMLGVKGTTLQAHGAVSEPTVREMIEGALARSHTQVAVAVSGVAGPSDGHLQTPVGTVCFGWGVKGAAPQTATEHFDGDREAVRRQSVVQALHHILSLVSF